MGALGLVWLVAGAVLLLGAVLVGAAVAGFRREHRVGPTLLVLLALPVFALGGAAALAAIGMGAYAALTHEQTAAVVEVAELEPQRFRATVTLPEGEQRAYLVLGDELYVDARILKWHAAANLLGLRTAYQLDRIGGRYRSIDDEQTRPRSVERIGDPGPVDLFALVERFPVLEPLVDAEYGSGTFVPMEDGAGYAVQVSPTGLLMRRR